MAMFDFGQPHGGIIQMAYTVPDIAAAMRQWVDDLGVGPWFHLDRIEGIDPVYRGRPATGGAASIAMAYAGHMQIELIQPLDDGPSTFHETMAKRGYGFHHFGVATHDIDADIARHEARGRVLASRAGVLTGGSVAYIDTETELGGMLELIEIKGPTEAIFLAFYKAALGWNGADPIRSFEAAMRS